MRRALALVLALAAGASAPAAAQGSAFALRGLGWAARPVSARSAGFGGAFSIVDPQMSVNPAGLGRIRSVAGWAVAAPTEREFDGIRGPVQNQTVRFPLLGFGTSLPGRVSLGFSISDYLDRTFEIQTKDTVVINGTPEPFQDDAKSVGGISDVQIGAAYRWRPTFLVGIGFHYYIGSIQLTAHRTFDNVAYIDVFEAGTTDYRGAGVAVGAIWQPFPSLDLGASGRYNGKLRAEDTRTGDLAHVPLPHEAAFGLRWALVPGVTLAGSAQWAGWSRTNGYFPMASGGARDTWTLGAGVEIPRVTLVRLRTPLRAGYRVRQLPFLSLGHNVDEQAFSVGWGFNFAQDRAVLDFAVDKGDRHAGPTKETFTTLFVGVTIRP